MLDDLIAMFCAHPPVFVDVGIIVWAEQRDVRAAPRHVNSHLGTAKHANPPGDPIRDRRRSASRSTPTVMYDSLTVEVLLEHAMKE